MIFAVILVFWFAPNFIHAQNLTDQQRAQLQSELAQVEAEQKQAEKVLSETKAQSASLQRDIAVLDAKIKAAQLNIKAKNLLIQTLGNDIVSKEKHINNLENHIDRGRESLADILRKTNELDDYSLPEVILSQHTVAGFFQDVDTFGAVQTSLGEVFNQLKDDQENTKAEKDALDARRAKEVDARYAIQQAEKSIKSDQQQKNTLLGVSKGNEKAYAGVVAQKQARAAQIRAALFALRDAAAIPFGKALQYANAASAVTGVRPALLLAILTQESALGKNVGQCYVTNYQTGDGLKAKSGLAIAGVMSPKRDIPPFLRIMEKLGGDPKQQVVSCPLDIGWGGAMGPAQFIASTWVLFEDRIAAAVGISGTPDPWNPSHAFMASAIYLGDLGAGSKTYSAERNAACKYYSGRACGLVTGNTSYGNSVMSLADKIQREMIDPLQGL
ncbi:MAG: lytic murein transglycosylase [Candidatus Paceibacterota bacterium]